MKVYTGWWFQIFFIFTPTWGRFPFWLIFFKRVETTNKYRMNSIMYPWFVFGCTYCFKGKLIAMTQWFFELQKELEFSPTILQILQYIHGMIIFPLLWDWTAIFLAWQCILHSPSQAGQFGTPEDQAVEWSKKPGRPVPMCDVAGRVEAL